MGLPLAPWPGLETQREPSPRGGKPGTLSCPPDTLATPPSPPWASEGVPNCRGHLQPKRRASPRCHQQLLTTPRLFTYVCLE